MQRRQHIIRQPTAFLGLSRFDEFQESLGIARNVLTDRLNRLVDEGILERTRYNERPQRYEYRLTSKGEELRLALEAALETPARRPSRLQPRKGSCRGTCRVLALTTEPQDLHSC